MVNLPTNMGDIRDKVRSLGQEDPLEEGIETHSSFPAWRIPMDRKSGRLQFIGSQRVKKLLKQPHMHTHALKMRPAFLLAKHRVKR